MSLFYLSFAGGLFAFVALVSYTVRRKAYAVLGLSVGLIAVMGVSLVAAYQLQMGYDHMHMTRILKRTANAIREGKADEVTAAYDRFSAKRAKAEVTFWEARNQLYEDLTPIGATDIERPVPPRLDAYFETYCDYTGGLGIGNDPSDTYDYRFRQQLKTTRDPELKRLFVLQHLHRDIELGLADFQKGIVRTGKSSSRALTLSEWKSTQQSIQKQLDDLAAYSVFTNFVSTTRNPLDPYDQSLDNDWIGGLRRTLRTITNAPAANKP